MEDIKAQDKPTIMIYNKIDVYTNETIESDDLITEKTLKHFTLEELEKHLREKYESNVFISAIENKNIEEFKSIVYKNVRNIHQVRFPYNDYLFSEYDQDGTPID